MAIKNVAVAGATGNLGRYITEALVQGGFQVTILTRDAKTFRDGGLPTGVAAAKQIDYTSADSLQAALKGQDAVVSVLGSQAVSAGSGTEGGPQTALVDAAVAAGVRRFIPSEFGVNTRKARGSLLGGLLAGKIAAVDYLIEKATASGSGPGAFSWTGISTGLFAGWGLARGGFGFDRVSHTVTIYDSGNEPIHTSNLAFIGQAVAAALVAGDKTANQYLEIASFTPTQRQLLHYVEQQTGEKWALRQASTADAAATAQKKLAQGDRSAFGDLLKVWLFVDGAGHAPQLGSNSDNALLGLEAEDVQASINEWLGTF